MLDIKRIREDFEGVKERVAFRGKGDFGIDNVKKYDEERRALLADVEALSLIHICISDQISPARIPKIMGFVMMPFPVLRKSFLSRGSRSGLKTARTITARML